MAGKMIVLRGSAGCSKCRATRMRRGDLKARSEKFRVVMSPLGLEGDRTATNPAKVALTLSATSKGSSLGLVRS